MRRLRTISVLPTMFTLGNLVCGFFAIVVAARVARPESMPVFADADVQNAMDVQNVMISGWLIFLGMVFDALDGHVARLARVTSDFGAQLDSLCDAITFGVAPGFLLVKMCPRFTYLHEEALFTNEAVWVIAASFAACAAMRLARFNVETTEDDDHLHFTGLPSPAAAASIAGFALMFHTLHTKGANLAYAPQIDNILQMILPFYAVLLALLMVSRIPYPHVVNQIFHGQRSFGHVVAVIFSLVAVMVIRGYSVPIICAYFVLSGPARFYWEKLVQRRHQEDTAF
jgi:CDP-diacylglycerol--serine O-phosphatidyltransferase